MTTTHFYTTDNTEALAAVANMQATSEGVAFWALAQNPSEFVPMYRVDHAAKGTHLFTTFIDERDAAVNEDGYQGAGIGFWCLPADNTSATGVQPLFRLYNATTDDHFYTIDAHETAPGYKREGIACLVFTAQSGNSVPLLRFLSSAGRHFYSVDMQPPGQFTLEGTCGFVFGNASGAPQPLFRSYNPLTGGHLLTADIAEHDAASKNNAYRGDGISCYLFGDGTQAGGTVPLLRAYNKGLDDHFYTIDAAEHAHAIQALGYVDEGTTGWVFSLGAGPNAPGAKAAQRFLGNFVNDFFLSPPGLPAFLSGNSNFFMTSEIGAGVDPIVGLDVEVAITADITVSSVDFGTLGMGLQLNAYSPNFFTSSWQQFALTLFDGNIQCEIQNWAESPYAVGFIVDSARLCHSDGNTIPAGWRLRMSLFNDEFANVLGADFYVYNGKHQLGHKRLTIKNFKNSSVFGAAPIVGFQLVLVGPFDGETATLASGGAGIITYKAAVPLCASNDLPAVAEWPGVGTGEQSNTVYGEIASTKSKTLTQTLGVGTVRPFSLLRARTLLKHAKQVAAD